jgi:glycosyltransferase involved in cell wall biosynthesis
MKILMLADPCEPHTIKWVDALTGRGVEVILFSFVSADESLYRNHQQLTFYDCGLSRDVVTQSDGHLSKLRYLKALPGLKKIIRRDQPDILHAHYASGYGFIGALSGFQPFVLSAWGSDVLYFPGISILHKKLIRFVVRRARQVCSTSEYMVPAIESLGGHNPQVIPFGVDTDVFYRKEGSPSHKEVVLGSIKNLKPEYSIRSILQVYQRVRQMLPQQGMRLKLVGEGSERESLEQLARSLDIADEVDFLGFRPYQGIARYHNMLDIYINLSTLESFGVSVLEASACERPVVASDTGGLREVVSHGKTGFLVEPGNVEGAAQAVRRLIEDPGLRQRLGANGRQWVSERYSLSQSVDKMLSLYEQIINHQKIPGSSEPHQAHKDT